MDLSFNVMQDTLRDALKIEMTDLTDEQPDESGLNKLLNSAVVDILDDDRIGHAL